MSGIRVKRTETMTGFCRVTSGNWRPRFEERSLLPNVQKLEIKFQKAFSSSQSAEKLREGSDAGADGQGRVPDQRLLQGVCE